MKILRPSSRLIRRATPKMPKVVDMHRRRALRLSMAAMGAGLLACAGDESNASGAGGGGSGAGGTGDCTEPDPTDGDKLIAPDDGADYGEMTIKVPVGRLSENFGLMETNVEPRQLLIPHTHQLDDQVVYVIAGELEFEFGGEGGETFVAPTGSYVIKPRYLSHGFWNPSDTEEARYIEMSTRTFFEPFVMDSATADTKDEVDAIAAEAGIEFHYDHIPRLFLQHMLQSIKGMDEPSPGMFVPNGKNVGG